MSTGRQSGRTFDDLVRARYGHAIDEYARGSAELELHAIRQCYPAIAALELDESYATLVLTARMDSLLAKIIEFGAGRQGGAEELLFDTLKPLSSFSGKTNMAYFLGFITKRMFDAINCARAIRNVYAHCESPDDARNDPKYSKNKAKLLQIDLDFSRDSVRRLRASIEDSEAISDQRIELTAVMVEICDSLDRVAAMNRLYAKQIKRPVVPAIFGFEFPTLPENDEQSVGHGAADDADSSG